MLLRTDPNMPVAPPAQLPQLPHLCMLELHVVLHRQPARVVDAYVAPQSPQDPRHFVREQFAVRARSEASVEHQDAEAVLVLLQDVRVDEVEGCG